MSNNDLELTCLNCRYLNKETFLSCEAFPDGIPHQFSSGMVPHIEIVKDQSGDYIWRIDESLIQSSDIDKTTP